MVRILLFFYCCACGVTDASAQTIYQSKGANGVPVYSDRPPADGNIEKTYVYEYLPSSPVSEPPQPAQATPQYHRVPRNGRPASVESFAAGSQGGSAVTLFGASWCPYCRSARKYLSEHQIAYQEFDIDTPAGRSAYVAAGGRTGVPLLVVGTRHVQGFTAQGYDGVFAAR